MKTPTALTSLVLLVALSAAAAAGPVAQPRLVRVQLRPGLTAEDLLRAGLDLTDVKGDEARVLEWPGDEARLARLGTHIEVVDPTPGRTAALRAQAELSSRPPVTSPRVRGATETDRGIRVQSPPPFGSGSMGGYWTAAEIKMKLDELVANDVNDLIADKIDTIGYSRELRPIWGLKVGKTVVGPDPRPVAFYNALTHAREPEGMQALFYFLDDLLSRYGTDPFATYLLEKRVIYIVPLVNPDGYAQNEAWYTGSGGTSFGYWRKNTRDNNGNLTIDNGDGVDLNRNYGYKWAYNDTGSSPVPTDETYRGPSAVSEPETQAQAGIVAQLAPKTGLSFHTFSDLMLHAWGHTMANTPHEAWFREWSDELTRDNAYLSGNSPRVLYPVNGEFNDWCYGDTLAKPRAFTWTPEVGNDNDGFWPSPSRIVPLAKENLRTCTVIAAIAGPFVQADELTLLEGAMNAGHATQLQLRARNLGSSGLAGPGLTGTIVPLDAGAHVLVGSVAYPDLGPRTSGDPAAPFYVALEDTVTPGRLMRFEVRFTDDAGLFSRDTVAVPAGTPTVLVADDASSMLSTHWTAEGSPTLWGIVSNDPEHLSRYIAESPTGNYGNLWNTRLRLTTPATFNLSAGVHAYALFEARWQFEQNYDAAWVEASFNGTTWTRVTGTGMTPGSGIATPQPAGVPLYAGARRNWQPERVDLSPFTGAAGTAVQLRLRMQSDNGTNFDGFNFDSFRVVLYDPAAQPVPVAVGGGGEPVRLALESPAPNPVQGFARFAFALPRAGAVRLEILDVQGRSIQTLANGTLPPNRYVRGWDLRDAEGHAVSPGIYLARLSDATGSVTRRFALIR